MPTEAEESPSHAEIMVKIATLEGRLAEALNGVTAELVRQRESKSELARFVWGGSNGAGLAELVRQHERWIGTQRKIFLVLVPAIVLAIGAVVWEAVVTTIRQGTG